MEMSENITDIAGALATAQAEIEGAAKDRVNPDFKSAYATLASVWDACRSPLSKNGLAVTQGATAEGQTVTVTTMLLHKSGQWFRSKISMQAMNATPQAIGSAVTYGRRYSLSAMVGVAPDDDDDGNSATGRHHQPQPEQIPVAPPAPAVSDEEMKAWRKWRASANKTMQNAKTMDDLESKRKGLEEITKKGASLWSQRTYHNDIETFGTLFAEHKARVERDVAMAGPEGIKVWIRGVMDTPSAKGLAGFVKQYREEERFQVPECEEALHERALQLGLQSYTDCDEPITESEASPYEPRDI